MLAVAGGVPEQIHLPFAGRIKFLLSLPDILFVLNATCKPEVSG